MEARIRQLEIRTRLMMAALIVAIISPWIIAAQPKIDDDGTLTVKRLEAQEIVIQNDGKVAGFWKPEGINTAGLRADLVGAQEIMVFDKEWNATGIWQSKGLQTDSVSVGNGKTASIQINSKSPLGPVIAIIDDNKDMRAVMGFIKEPGANKPVATINLSDAKAHTQMMLTGEMQTSKRKDGVVVIRRD